MRKIPFLLILLAMVSCDKSNKLVAYFSATGHTETVARQIAFAAGADIFEILPSEPYTDADLDWRDSLSRSTVEMADRSSRPSILRKVDKLEKYDTLFIGFPIWWYTAPTIINTFLEENDLSGKTVKLFATSGGSDITGAVRDLKAAYSDVDWAGGLLLNTPSEDELKLFLDMRAPAPALCGGWSEQRKPTEEELAIFSSATDNNPDLKPLMVSTQVVAGINYKFFCSFEPAVRSGQKPDRCQVVIFKPLEGNPELISYEEEL